MRDPNEHIHTMHTQTAAESPQESSLMARFYHALSDQRRCTKCKAACAIFGQRDPETSWQGWCTPCNRTWHNRRIETTIFMVCRNFAKHSLATLVGSENNAVTILAFLQISSECIRYTYDLRHRLEVQVLEWLCCPLAWFYESDSEAEMERIQRPVLRSLQETFIGSAAFEATCFPCLARGEPWTLLHAICTFVRKSTAVHSCCPPQSVNVHGTYSDGLTILGCGMKQQMNTSISTIHQKNGNANSFTERNKNSITGQLEKDGFWNQQIRNGVLS